MTMDKMVEEFERKGFKASRKYESKEKRYRFEIEKDGICDIGYFVYSLSGESYGDFLMRQQNFIKTLVNSWEETKAAKTNGISFNNELLNRSGRAYICLEAGDSLCIPVCIDRIDYGPDESPSFEGHFCDILSECRITKAGNSQITIEEDKDNIMKIKVVHFSGPVTTVIWEDGTKSQVRCQDGDRFDPEKGLALAIAKRVLGNKGSWYDEIKKWVDRYYDEVRAVSIVEDMFKRFNDRINSWRSSNDKPVEPVTNTTPEPPNNTTSYASVCCGTCKYFDNPVTQNPCSGCDWHYSCWELSEEVAPPVESKDEPQVTHYNPVEEAYNIALKIRDGKYGSIDEIIGFLGEALNN